MSSPTPSDTPRLSKIFLSYRRSDSAGHVGRLYDELVRYFGRDRVFMDIDGIAPGQNFVEVLTDRLREAAVVLVLIGPRWAGPLETGGRRLDDAGDFVRMEVVEALSRPGTQVIPVLCGGAVFPATDTLPDAIKPLALRNAFELSDLRWKQDVRRLQDTVQPFMPLEPLVKGDALWTSPPVLAAAAGLLLLLWWGPWRSSTVPSVDGTASPQSSMPKAMDAPAFPGKAVKMARKQLADAKDDWASDAYLSNFEVSCDLSAKCTVHLTLISDSKQLFLNWWHYQDRKDEFHQSGGANPREPIVLDGVLELDDAIAKAKGYGLASTLSSVFLEMFPDESGRAWPVWLLFPNQMPGTDGDRGFCLIATSGERVPCRNFRG